METAVHTGEMTARVEQKPDEYQAILHPPEQVAGKPTHILEITVPDDPYHHFYLVRIASEGEIAHEGWCYKGGWIILLRTQWGDKTTGSFECLVWYVIGNDYGYAYDETIEDAQKSLAYWQAHPEEVQ